MPHVKAPARSLITALLEHEPEKRPTAHGVLHHKWVTTHCKPADEEGEGSEPRGAGAGEPPVWWCDVAGPGCVRPTEGRYTEAHNCWQYKGEYMVCEVCYASGKVEHKDELRLVGPDLKPLAVPPPPPPPAAPAAPSDVSAPCRPPARTMAAAGQLAPLAQRPSTCSPAAHDLPMISP